MEEQAMGDDLTEIRNGHVALKERVTHLESKVEQEAGRRAGMDKKLDDILTKVNAHEKSLSALRVDQAEQGKTLKDHTSRLARIEGRLGRVEDRLGRVEEGIGTVKIGVHAILELLNTNLAETGDNDGDGQRGDLS
jgi:chromosome segregation ATPase